MKNLLLAITTTIAIIAIIIAIREHNHNLVQCPVFCDNSLRKPLNPLDGGGSYISFEDAEKLMSTAKGKLKDDNIKKHLNEYYTISKKALDDIFNNDPTATGIIIAPYFEPILGEKPDPDNINLLIARTHSAHTEIETVNGALAYTIKTFCPEICDQSK